MGLNKRNRNKEEEYNRSNHNDFATASELKARQFTGLRMNSISEDAEIWLMGELKASISPSQLAIDPMAVSKAYEEVFALDSKVLPDTPQARKLGHLVDTNKTGLIIKP